MFCWKCGGQVVSDRCTLCGCVQSTRKPAETEAGKALRDVYDRFGARRTLTEDGFLSRCLSDVLPMEPELRKGLRSALNAGIGRELFHMLESNAPMDDNARAGLQAMLVSSAGILSNEMLLEVMNALLDMIGLGTSSSQQKNNGQEQPPKPRNSPSTTAQERPMHPKPQPEIRINTLVPLAVLYHVKLDNITSGVANLGSNSNKEHAGVLYLYSTGIAFYRYKHALALGKHAECQESPEVFMPIEAVEQVIEHDVFIAYDFTIVLRHNVRFYVSASNYGYNRKDAKAFVKTLRQRIH